MGYNKPIEKMRRKARVPGYLTIFDRKRERKDVVDILQIPITYTYTYTHSYTHRVDRDWKITHCKAHNFLLQLRSL